MKDAAVLETAIRKITTDRPVRVYRGLQAADDPVLAGLLSPGTVFTDKGFVSTTSSYAVAKGFAAGTDAVMIAVDLPAGSNALAVDVLGPDWSAFYDKEHELLLPTNARYTVTKVEWRHDRHYVSVVADTSPLPAAALAAAA